MGVQHGGWVEGRCWERRGGGGKPGCFSAPCCLPPLARIASLLPGARGGPCGGPSCGREHRVWWSSSSSSGGRGGSLLLLLFLLWEAERSWALGPAVVVAAIPPCIEGP